ncbi:hypothetical protein CEV31_3570 [Brucella thiophenivorans]|uniref:Uncharacterized protein n=1 Tax=Brucella thiophenivorans TaxID=571255 RepID=A0A256FCU6_9HYPH|nr:hypothetical protein CEV31_3570 [Brucella thiophenivorans]
MDETGRHFQLGRRASVKLMTFTILAAQRLFTVWADHDCGIICGPTILLAV